MVLPLRYGFRRELFRFHASFSVGFCADVWAESPVEVLGYSVVEKPAGP